MHFAICWLLLAAAHNIIIADAKDFTKTKSRPNEPKSRRDAPHHQLKTKEEAKHIAYVCRVPRPRARWKKMHVGQT